MPGITSTELSGDRSQPLSGRAVSLRPLALAAGISWSLLFVVLGLHYELQMYGDGSIFCYSIAVDDAWAFHWHNIIGRVFVYLLAYLPAHLYLDITRNAHRAIDVYGFMFFAAPVLGLIATFAVDRSKGRIFFAYACFSTACLCPLVFGFPTEIWMAHSLFWPALAFCHHARPGIGHTALAFAMLLALVFTHEGALIFAVTITATLLLRRRRNGSFLRTAIALLLVVTIWMIAHAMLPPDDYDSDVLRRAAWHVFDPSILTWGLVLLLAGALASYAIAFLALRQLSSTRAHLYALAVVVVMLVAYWMWFDDALHAENRYYLRTVVLVATPVFGILAALQAVAADGQLRIPVASHQIQVFTADMAIQAVTGALLVVLLVHAVETAKFIRAWTDYKAAVRALATGTTSDPALGDPRFVSSERINPRLAPLAWSSTTHFLSVLVAPGLAPERLVVDPKAGYFWLACETATASRDADSTVPVDARELIRVHACQHR